MVANPDQTRRKDSLRQFIVTLFERKQLKQLASYPYIDMFEELEHIIEARARSVDLSVNNYYDFLYSFHISKENFRKGKQNQSLV
jgi:nuclear pore complex protein Nup160